MQCGLELIQVEMASSTVRRSMIDGRRTLELASPPQQPMIRDTDVHDTDCRCGGVITYGNDVENSTTLVSS